MTMRSRSRARQQAAERGGVQAATMTPLMAYMKKKAEESKNAFVRLRSRES